MAGFIKTVLNEIAREVTGRKAQQIRPEARYRDWQKQGESFSIESVVADTLTNLVCSDFRLAISGDSERALMMDAIADRFVRDDLQTAMSLGFVTGDAIIVPFYEGDGHFTNVCVSAPDFRIISSKGGRPIALAYVVDEKRDSSEATYSLLQVMELEDYGDSKLCHYTLKLARNDRLIPTSRISRFAEWEDYEADWYVPNVDRLLVGRYKCFMRDKRHPNAVYGAPLCYGASSHIEEIHYLLAQMHNEFELSEKAVMADRRLFTKNANGELTLPRGRERLFMQIRGDAVDSSSVSTWSPTIQNVPYQEALEVRKKELEKTIGVDSGILSTPDDMNYQNVDNVRKSTRNTQSFVNRARGVADDMMEDLVYSWNVLLNYFSEPMGDFEVQHKWSDDYINTFADMRDSLVSGYQIGATDALDYRLFVLGEAPEVARQRVEEISAGRMVSIVGEE